MRLVVVRHLPHVDIEPHGGEPRLAVAGLPAGVRFFHGLPGPGCLRPLGLLLPLHLAPRSRCLGLAAAGLPLGGPLDGPVLAEVPAELLVVPDEVAQLLDLAPGRGGLELRLGKRATQGPHVGHKTVDLVQEDLERIRRLGRLGRLAGVGLSLGGRRLILAHRGPDRTESHQQQKKNRSCGEPDHRQVSLRGVGCPAYFLFAGPGPRLSFTPRPVRPNRPGVPLAAALPHRPRAARPRPPPP